MKKINVGDVLTFNSRFNKWATRNNVSPVEENTTFTVVEISRNEHGMLGFSIKDHREQSVIENVPLGVVRSMKEGN